ncbi:hypothetical protein NX059_007853 [Plenodomus lindquistii]|nr:hypothetical protein NX059_007853 [Plenodomus lindquistii]
MSEAPSIETTIPPQYHEADQDGSAPTPPTSPESPSSLSNLTLAEIRTQNPNFVTMNWIAPHLTTSERRKYHAKYRKLHAHYTAQHNLIRRENAASIQAAKATLLWIAKCKVHADSDAVRIEPTYLEAQEEPFMQDTDPKEPSLALVALKVERTAFVMAERARKERMETLRAHSLFEVTHGKIRDVEEQAAERLVKNFIAREFYLKCLVAVEEVMRRDGEEGGC